MACVRPSGLEAGEQVYRKDKMAAYGGEGNLSSLVVKRLGCCDLVLMVLNSKKSIKRW